MAIKKKKKTTKKKKSSTSTIKRKVGRPTAYRKEFCDLLIAHMSDGYSFETFGYTIGICDSVVRRWAVEIEDFKAAKKKAVKACQHWFETVGRQQMVKGKGSSASWRFSMINRFAWSDSPSNAEEEQTGKTITIKLKE
jgi:hypothetical protein